ALLILRAQFNDLDSDFRGNTRLNVDNLPCLLDIKRRVQTHPGEERIEQILTSVKQNLFVLLSRLMHGEPPELRHYTALVARNDCSDADRKLAEPILFRIVPCR